MFYLVQCTKNTNTNFYRSELIDKKERMDDHLSTSVSTVSDVEDSWSLLTVFDENNLLDLGFLDIDFNFNLYDENTKKKTVNFREVLEDVKTFYRGHRIDCECFTQQKECEQARMDREAY